MFNLSKEQLEEIRKIFSNPNNDSILNDIDNKINAEVKNIMNKTQLIKNIMNKTQLIHNNRTMIENTLLESFALTGIMKKDIEENIILNGENSLDELKEVLGHLLTNQIILSAEIYRLCFKNDKKAE